MQTRKNIAASVDVKRINSGTATAGGTGDNTKVTGEVIDRLGFASGIIALNYTTTLAAGKKLSFAVAYEGSDDNSTYATEASIQASTQAATSAGGGTVTGVVKIPIDLSGYKRYLKINVTPDLDATGTDTAAWSGSLILGGKDTEPV